MRCAVSKLNKFVSCVANKSYRIKDSLGYLRPKFGFVLVELFSSFPNCCDCDALPGCVLGRCVGGGVNRLPVEQSDNFFNISHSVNNGQAPHSANLTPGSTWKFQCWFRDTVAGGSGFNLSNGKSITFQN